MAMVPMQSSLLQALAAEAGAAMQNVDPMDVLNSAKTAQRMFRGYLGRKRAAARRSTTYKKRKTTRTSRFQLSRQNTVPAYSVPPDTGVGADVQFGLLKNSELVAPDFNSNNVGATDSLTCDVRGYKICREFYFNGFFANTTQLGPVEVHYAIIQWKCPISQASVDALLPEKFFRASYYNDKMGEDFGLVGSPSNAYPLAGDPWLMKLNCLAMNPNNGYNIITHKKRVIAPIINGDRPAGGKGYGGNCWKIDMWLPIGKKMELEDKNTARWKYPLYEVYWVNAINSMHHSSDTASQSGLIKTNVHNKVYYKPVR